MERLHLPVVEANRRTATILTAYYMPKPGGLCVRLFRAIIALLDAGHVVHYSAVRPFPIDDPNCIYHRLWWPLRVEPSGAVFWVYLHLTMPLHLLYLATRYRVTHAFAFSINYGAMLAPVRVLRRIRYVLFLRADTMRNNRINGVHPAILRAEHVVEALALVRANVVAVSASLLEDVTARHRRAHPRAADVLRNEPPNLGISCPRYSGGRLEIAAVGVIEARKNPQLLINMVAGLADLDVRLHYFGTGPYEAQLRALAAPLVSDGRVLLHGWQPPERIWPMIHLLAHSSLHEGVSNAILEAMACGAMVLASDIPEHREWIDGDLLLPLSHPERWADRVRRIVTEPDARARVVKGADETRRSLSSNWNKRITDKILGSE